MNDAAQAMTLAHTLRETEGLPMDEALREAWTMVRGDEDALNPLDELWENPEASPILMLALLAGAGVGIYRLVKKEWPWETIAKERAKKAAVAEAQRIARLKASQGAHVLEYHSVIPLQPTHPGQAWSETPMIIEP